MMKIENKGIKLFISKEEEIIEKIVKEDHVFRKLNKIIDFEKLIFPYRKLYSDMGAEGINIAKGFVETQNFASLLPGKITRTEKWKRFWKRMSRSNGSILPLKYY